MPPKRYGVVRTAGVTDMHLESAGHRAQLVRLWHGSRVSADKAYKDLLDADKELAATATPYGPSSKYTPIPRPMDRGISRSGSSAPSRCCTTLALAQPRLRTLYCNA